MRARLPAGAMGASFPSSWSSTGEASPWLPLCWRRLMKCPVLPWAVRARPSAAPRVPGGFGEPGHMVVEPLPGDGPDHPEVLHHDLGPHGEPLEGILAAEPVDL